ncbi:S-layer homology domain-containing protein [Paenibacillus hamazuiensis]|uniref:S-layer homology domain-containing protein n=1 Tax=Paenibacillus hamazuiensis TaxID=2936508 RepID=UPI00200D384C|nr:S-layer homology domain-containing protein [Paenibacillus hamazuiensis]
MKKVMTPFLCFLLIALTLFPIAFASAAGADTPGAKSVNDFKDLKDLPQDVKAKFDELIKGGVFSGVSDDTFGLDAQMDRAQFAKVATIIFALPFDSTVTKSSFADIPSGHWSLAYVEALKKAGLTNGYDAEGKTYNPSGAVSRQELAAFLIRGLGLDDAAKKTTPIADATVDDWAKGYAALALEKNLLTKLDDGTFGGKVSATRKMLALAGFEAKKLFADKGQSGQTPAQQTPAPTQTPGTQPDTPTPQPSQSGKPSVNGKKVVITSDIKNGSSEFRDEEKAMVNRLQSMGFTVTRLASTKLEYDAVKDYDLVVIGWSTNSKYVKKKLKPLPVPIIYNKSVSFGDADFSTVAEKTNVSKQTSMTIKDGSHPLAAGLKGEVPVYYEPADIQYGKPSKDAIVIATAKDDAELGTIIAYEKGSKNVLGETVAARTVMFGPGAPQMKENSTDELWKLFEASVMWAIGSSDSSAK